MLIRIGQNRNCETPEGNWVNVSEVRTLSWLPLLVIGILGIAGAVVVLAPKTAGPAKAGVDRSAVGPEDTLRAGLDAAEAVARLFLAESNPKARFQWSRNAAGLRDRISAYPEEARIAPGKIDKMIGHLVENGRAVTGFVVAFPSGDLRLLEVVGTPEGPRVDWDAYARHGTASWEDLWSGKVEQAVVRVFCEPATERPAPFDDGAKWTTLRLSSPDLPQVALGFVEVGSVREEMMKKVILGSPRYRQRFVIEIRRHQGESEPLFEITRCLAVGWIEDETPVENLWIAGASGGNRHVPDHSSSPLTPALSQTSTNLPE
jgi:hypothetical protein